MSGPDDDLGHFRIDGNSRVWVPNLVALRRPRPERLTQAPDRDGVLWVDLTGGDELEATTKEDE